MTKPITDKDGNQAVIINETTDGEGRLLVDYNGQRLLIPLTMCEDHAGGYRLNASFSALLSSQEHQDAEVISLMAETARVDKQQVERGRVRINKSVAEHEELVNVPIMYEEVEVERVQINRPAEGEVGIRYEGDTMIVPLLEEVVVVETRTIVREELHIRKKRVEDTHQERVTLRREEVDVERLEKNR
jgi:uncharacterized protein (TIGR02271 family)